MTDTVIYEEDALLQQLADTEDEWSAGSAKYGPGGLFDALRKVYLDTRALQIRNAATEKMTEAAISTAAHADEDYSSWLEMSLVERAQWLALDAHRDRIYMKLKVIISRGFDAKRNGA